MGWIRTVESNEEVTRSGGNRYFIQNATWPPARFLRRNLDTIAKMRQRHNEYDGIAVNGDIGTVSDANQSEVAVLTPLQPVILLELNT